MHYEKAIQLANEQRLLRRPKWKPDEHITGKDGRVFRSTGKPYAATKDDALASDWELVANELSEKQTEKIHKEKNNKADTGKSKEKTNAKKEKEDPGEKKSAADKPSPDLTEDLTSSLFSEDDPHAPE